MLGTMAAKIETAWMFVTVDPVTGFEELLTVDVASGPSIPAIALDRERRDWLLAAIKRHPPAQPVRLVQLSHRVDCGEVALSPREVDIVRVLS